MPAVFMLSISKVHLYTKKPHTLRGATQVPFNLDLADAIIIAVYASEHERFQC